MILADVTTATCDAFIEDDILELEEELEEDRIVEALLTVILFTIARFTPLSKSRDTSCIIPAELSALYEGNVYGFPDVSTI